MGWCYGRRLRAKGCEFLTAAAKMWTCCWIVRICKAPALMYAEEWRWWHSRGWSGDPQDPFAPVLLAPSLFTLQGSFSLQASSLTVCMEGVFFSAQLQPQLLIVLLYLGLLPFLNRELCQGEDKIDQKCCSSVFLSLLSFLSRNNWQMGPRENQEREGDVWILLRGKTNKSRLNSWLLRYYNTCLK